MMNKKEANVLMKEYLDKLLQKQMIDQKVYDKAVKKFASGGAVVDPLAVIAAAQEPEQMSTSALTPQEQASLDATIERAKQNTVEQAAKNAVQPGAIDQIKATAMKSPIVRNIVEEKLPIVKNVGEMVIEAAPRIGRAALEAVPGAGGIIQGVNMLRDMGEEQLAKESGQVFPGQEQPSDTRTVLAQRQGMQQTADRMPGVSPAQDMIAEQRDQFSFMEDAIKEGARIGSQAAAAESAFVNQKAKDMEILQREQILKQKQIAEKTAEFDAKIRELNDKAVQASQIDPNRWWNSRTTTQKVLATIGLMLGGTASAEMMFKFIDNDIQAQKNAAAGARQGVEEMSNLYRQNLAALKDELAATLATKDTMLGIAELKLRSLSAQTDNQRVRANAQLELGKLNLERAKVQKDLRQQMAMESFLAGGDASGGNAALRARLPKEMRELVVDTPDGQALIAKTDDDAKKLKDSEANFKRLFDALDIIESNKGFTVNPFNEKAGDAEAAYAGLGGIIKDLEKLGALDQGVERFIEKILPPPTSFNQVKVKSGIKILKERMEKDRENNRQLRASGYAPLKLREPSK